ncbi:MAG: DUF4381 domain-containing protein [Gammaproteobacteria bacterium]|nr:DUF4381 domain-containing protein [Gammaproteobacteria bacterium]
MEQAQLPLRDIHVPEAVGWWPPAPGWWILAVLVPLLIGLLWWLYRRITKKTAVKAAQKLLLQIKRNKDGNTSQQLQALSALIRRVAISTSSRDDCAGLTGQQWLDYLNRSLKTPAFNTEIGRLLIESPYRQVTPTEKEIGQLVSLCEDWIKAQSKRKR